MVIAVLLSEKEQTQVILWVAVWLVSGGECFGLPCEGTMAVSHCYTSL